MPTNAPIQVGEFWFYPSTGELKARAGEANSARLPPQPAQLLKMLIDHHPEVITHEATRRSLWPGVTSNLDQNLHFCVRQIRSALGDSASSPAYIETIPRRGYRLIAKVSKATDPAEASESPAAEVSPDDAALAAYGSTDAGVQGSDAQHNVGDEPRAPSRPPRAMSPMWIAASLLSLLALSYLLGGWNTPASNARVTIMPFLSDAEGFEVLGNGEIALELLQEFSGELEGLDLIGPTTTQPYLEAGMDLGKIVLETRADFVVNGKFLAGEPRNGVLVEIIRAHDGSHTWVKRFDASAANSTIARQTAAALRAQLVK